MVWSAFPLLITKRLKEHTNGLFANTIHKIVTTSICIGCASILIACIVMQGFQQEIKKN